jgi:poly [ADP-ribose] polymerase
MQLHCEFNYVSNLNPCFSNREDGVIVPMGPVESTNVVNPKGYTLNYNEYIVYDTKQVRMRYLIKLKFIFK